MEMNPLKELSKKFQVNFPRTPNLILQTYFSMKNISLIILIFLSAFTLVSAQELKCRVIVNDAQVQTQERQVFEDLQRAVTQFMNNRRWTNLTFNPEERINCNIQITLKPTDKLGTYTAITKVQSSRPVYGTGYETILLNYVDKTFDFEYVQSQPLEYSENSVTTNLTAMLSFYAYVIIGLDMDSFSKLGGTPYYQKAQNIMNMASQQFTNVGGWQAFQADNQSRYWLIENLMSPTLVPIREGLYTYHRLALDTFEKDPDGARKKIMDVLNKIKAANQQKRLSVLFNVFFDSKKDELVKIFSKGDLQIRKQAETLLTELDPVNATKYNTIVEG